MLCNHRHDLMDGLLEMQGLNLTEIVDDIAGSGRPGGFAWNRTLPPSAAFLPPAAGSGRQQQVLDCLVQEGRAVGKAAPQFALAALQALLNTKGWVVKDSAYQRMPAQSLVRECLHRASSWHGRPSISHSDSASLLALDMLKAKWSNAHLDCWCSRGTCAGHLYTSPPTCWVQWRRS